MARLPSAPKQSALSPTEKEQVHNAIVACLSKGMRPADIAKRIAGDDKQARKVWRQRIWRMLGNDPELQAKIAARARSHLVVDLIPITQRLGKRARRLGKPQEVKLAYEASGFHNPRVNHEHSGDIKVTLDIPRPEKMSLTEDVIDAEVVEE